MASASKEIKIEEMRTMRKPTRWMKLVKKTRKENPDLQLRDILKKAKKSYR